MHLPLTLLHAVMPSSTRNWVSRSWASCWCAVRTSTWRKDLVPTLASRARKTSCKVQVTATSGTSDQGLSRSNRTIADVCSGTCRHVTSCEGFRMSPHDGGAAPNMHSADFCTAVRSPYGDLSPKSGTRAQTSRGKIDRLHRTPAEFLPPRSLMTPDFAIMSGRGFAPGFLQTPPRDDALALRQPFAAIRPDGSKHPLWAAGSAGCA